MNNACHYQFDLFFTFVVLVPIFNRNTVLQEIVSDETKTMIFLSN